MIWGQMIWGAILAGLLGFTFRRAWRWEHGAEPSVLFSNKNGKETFVFVLPTVLFWILLLFFGMFVVRLGVPDGMIRFAALMADVLLILSAYFVLLLLLLPLLRRWLSARACAVLWLVPAFLSWQAQLLFNMLPLPRITLLIPRPLLPILGAVWLAGFLAVGGYYLISHLLFSAWVRRHSRAEPDAEILSAWKREQEALDYRHPVKLLRGEVSAPFSMGRTRRSRCTVLPERRYTPEELSMIFRHELHHLQRCDVDTKVFLCLCNALCWFNPLVWIATRKAAEDLERSCDEIVTETMGESERRAYARLLLAEAAPDRGCTTCLSAAAGTLRYRLKGIMEQRERRRGTVVLMAALFGCAMCFGVISLSDARGSFSSLILTPDAEITAVYDGRVSRSRQGDSAALLEALNGIELEHIAGLRNPALDDERIRLLLSDGRFATLTEEALILYDYRRYNGVGDCYLVKSAPDWDAVYACFEQP